MLRDIDLDPYSKDEARVAEFIVEWSDGALGGGDDPIGFLMAAFVNAIHKLENGESGTV